MSDPLPSSHERAEAEAALRKALALLDGLDLTQEAALVCEALEMLEASVSPATRAEAE